MAESVDALVSNTSGATHPGSIPGLGTKKKSNDFYYRLTFFVFQENLPKTSRFHFAGMQKLRTFEPETLKRHSKQLK